MDNYLIQLGTEGPVVTETSFAWNLEGLGDWNNQRSWTPGGGPPNNQNVTAVFGTRAITGPTTVVTEQPVTVNRIEFDNTTHGYAVAGLGNVNLTATTTEPSKNSSISALGTHEFQAPVKLHSSTTVDVGTSSSLVFNNALDLSGSTLSKTGIGTMSIRNNLITSGGTLNILEGTVSGNGTVGGDLNNTDGTIAPGNSVGVLTITGNLTNGSGGTIAVEIEGTDGAGESQGHDQIQVTGSNTLDGTLRITTGAHADPTTRAAADTFTVINSTGNSTGTFARVSYDGTDLSADFDGANGSLRDHIANGLFRNVEYGGNNVRVTNLFALEGDADGDKDIDITDFNILASNFDDSGINSATNDWTSADFDADGDIDITDFNALASNFADTGYVATSAVPEPSSFLLYAFGILTLAVFAFWRNLLE